LRHHQPHRNISNILGQTPTAITVSIMAIKAATTVGNHGWANSSINMTIRQIVLTWLNAALYLISCAMIGTGLVLELRLDDEEGPARLLWLGRDDWSELHFMIALGFIALVLIHLLLHWSWIKTTIRLQSTAVVIVLVCGVASIGALLIWPSKVDSVGAKGEQTEREHTRIDKD
jgi:hypothetical protein